jgi:hypothetical protein
VVGEDVKRWSKVQYVFAEGGGGGACARRQQRPVDISNDVNKHGKGYRSSSMFKGSISLARQRVENIYSARQYMWAGARVNPAP